MAAVSRAFHHWSFVVGSALTALVLFAALVSLGWTPRSPTAIAVAERLQAPSAAHWFGTDQFGRDIFSMIMVGARNSILVGTLAVSIGILCGTALGLFAAARRGWADDAVMRFADFAFAFPAVLSAILITALLGPGAVNSILAIGIFNVPVFARVARGAGRAVWTRDFVTAARAAGKTDFAITLEHVLPNIMGLLVVQATIQFALAILAEAGLSYLGIGTQPPNPSWGRMLYEAQTFLATVPLLAVFPGIAIAVSVLGLNLLGDGLRDLLDPRLARQR